jgi:Protein of unknown function (DUF2442)
VQNGVVISGVEVVQITPFGLWLDIDGKEYYLDYENYPWFKKSIVQSICNIERDSIGNLHWPDLDVDLEMDSLKNPEEYPLIYR